ncbi:TonB-dependent receptor [Salmonella enterica]|nr:TonB-dependent receptor [Salmonella enterica]ECD3736505.1 TonB-dependent receptor [Salmonella enterica subsp. enterica serovar Stanley]ECZ5203061.1 TonB-dependent receptor [Salmonella enterica subsp. enterica serovar Kentucky]EKI9898433.1 TonB-dependent receptor [Salmonella enterica subsp. enterica]EAQ3032833.1 TonB-dependent receptor [Salmonella enterica]
MKIPNSSRLCLGAALFLNNAVVCETLAAESDKEEAIIVQATRSTTSTENLPRTVTIISSQQIAERPGYAGIQSLLAEIPGIQYARSGGLGGQIMMRGFNSNEGRMVMAIDGDRYEGRNTLQFNMLDPSAIERIEVIRGPASALYGSDAMTGVINVVTRRAKIDAWQPFALTPRLRAAQWNSVNNIYGGRAELTGGGNGFDVMVGSSYQHANDYNTPEGKAHNSDSQSKAVDFNIGYRPGELSRWELSGRFVDVDTGRAGGLGAAPGYPNRLVSESPIIERYLRLAYEDKRASWLADQWESTLYRRDFRTDIYQMNRNPKNQAYTVQQIQVYSPEVWGGHLTAQKQMDDHAVSYGGDFWYSDTKGRKTYTKAYNSSGSQVSQTPLVPMERDTSTTNIGLFTNDNWEISDSFNLNSALRGDTVLVDIGSPTGLEQQIQKDAFAGKTRQKHYALTGSLGGVWKVTPQWHLVGNLSRGFHAPSAQSMVLTSVAGTVKTLPNPELKPETNITAELGLRWHGESQQISLTGWQSEYDNLITLVPINNSGLNQRQNVAKATLRGLELEGQAYFNENWSSRYSLATLWGANDTANQPLPAISPLIASVSLRYENSDWYSEAIVTASEGRKRIDKKQERETAGFANINLYAGAYLDAWLGEGFTGWRLAAGVENLFDANQTPPSSTENIRLPHTYTNPLIEPGRAFVLKLTVDY